MPEKKTYYLEVRESEAGQRLDLWLAQKIPELTRSQAKKLIEEGLVQVEGRVSKPAYKIGAGEKVVVQVPPPERLELVPEEVPFEILYQDRDLAVIVKPPGVVVHPAAGHFQGTLVHGLLKRLKDLSGIGGKLRPGIVHRLDKETSGLMVVAKNDPAHLALTRLFKSREIEKWYLALVHGVPEPRAGFIEVPVGRHPVHRKKMLAGAPQGREAKTFYRVREAFSKTALLEVRPYTGRTHQIRVHLSFIGHPILGDPLYGGRRPQGPKAPRTMLHAWRLKFRHPLKDEVLAFEAPLPPDFKALLEELRSCER